jgi:hypothetical protein
MSTVGSLYLQITNTKSHTRHQLSVGTPVSKKFRDRHFSKFNSGWLVAYLHKGLGSTLLKTAQAYAQLQVNQNYHKYPNTNSRNEKKPGHFQIPRRHSPSRHDPSYVTSALRSNYNNIIVMPLEENFIN